MLTDKVKQAILKYSEKHAVQIWAELVAVGPGGHPADISDEKIKAWQELDGLLDDILAELYQLRYLWCSLEPYIPIGPNHVDFQIGAGDGIKAIYNTRAFYEKRKNEA